MFNKFGFQLIALLILFAIILVIPVDVVWGGQNFQTIPTIGPTRTPTATTISSTTQPVNTQQPNQTATATKTVSITLIFTVDPTIQKTQPRTTTTEMMLKTEESASSEAQLEQEVTQSVMLPLVSSGEKSQSDLTEGQNNIKEERPIPAFVFPVLIVLILLIFYFIIRLTIKKPQNNQPPK